MSRLRVPAKDLRVGDVLVPTRRRVHTAPTRGALTPAGKVELSLVKASGDNAPIKGACFNARTIITVERP